MKLVLAELVWVCVFASLLEGEVARAQILKRILSLVQGSDHVRQPADRAVAQSRYRLVDSFPYENNNYNRQAPPRQSWRPADEHLAAITTANNNNNNNRVEISEYTFRAKDPMVAGDNIPPSSYSLDYYSGGAGQPNQDGGGVVHDDYSFLPSGSPSLSVSGSGLARDDIDAGGSEKRRGENYSPSLVSSANKPGVCVCRCQCCDCCPCNTEDYEYI